MTVEVSTYRPMLYTIAYGMLGCASTAEDMVQDTYFKWLKVDPEKIKDAKAYLIRSTTNTCLNYIKSIKAKKEELLDNFSPTFSNISVTPEISAIDLKCEVTLALSQIVKKLPPSERAVFVLKELFNFDYADLTSILGKKADNCRKLFSRAQTKLSEETERFQLDSDKLKKFVLDFKNATLGEFTGLIESLKKDLD
ncbi:MAG: sigma-70 family RNA polymerase sigma factor [Reichenbachiella sp.]